MVFIAMLIFFAAQIALGQDAAQTMFGGPVSADNPICQIIESAGITWPIFGQIFGILTAAAIFLRPFSNMILKLALILTAMPTPAAKAAGKIMWILGSFAAVPAAGTPPVMQQVFAGTVTPPVTMKKKDDKAAMPPAA